MLVREVDTDVKTGAVTERWVERPDVVTAEVQAAVDQKNAAAAAVVTANEQTIGQQALSAMESLRQVRDAASLSPTQQTAFNKLVARVLLLLLRVAFRRFDATT